MLKNVLSGLKHVLALCMPEEAERCQRIDWGYGFLQHRARHILKSRTPRHILKYGDVSFSILHCRVSCKVHLREITSLCLKNKWNNFFQKYPVKHQVLTDSLFPGHVLKNIWAETYSVNFKIVKIVHFTHFVVDVHRVKAVPVDQWNILQTVSMSWIMPVITA